MGEKKYDAPEMLNGKKIVLFFMVFWLSSSLQLKVYGAFRVSVKMLLMWNSRIQIDGGGTVTTSILEVRNLVVLTVGLLQLILI